MSAGCHPARSVSRWRHQRSAPGLPEQVRQLIPLDQEGVVALGRADLAVVGRRRRPPAPSTSSWTWRGPYRMSSSMPTPVRRVPAAASRPKAPTRRPRRRRCRGGPSPRPGSGRSPGRTARSSLSALVIEVADDRRPPVGLDRPAEALVEVGLAPVGGHRQLPREGEAVEAEALDQFDLDVVPGDRHRSGGGRGGDRHDGRTARGRASATSSATIPPSEPPTTRSSRSTPSASRRRHWARAWSRVETAGNDAPYGRPVAGSTEVGPVVP